MNIDNGASQNYKVAGTDLLLRWSRLSVAPQHPLFRAAFACNRQSRCEIARRNRARIDTLSLKPLASDAPLVLKL